MIKFVSNYKIKGIEPCTIEECKAFLLSQTLIGLDTETTGLDPHSSKIIMLQLGTKEIQYVIDCRCTDVSSLFEILTNDKIKKLGANLKYDYKLILSNWGIRLQGIQDVQITEKILCNGLNVKSVSLKVLVEKYANVELDKDDRLEFTTIGKKYFNERHIKYGAMDVEILFDIWNKQEVELEKEYLVKCDYLEQKYVRLIAEKEYNGMHVDINKWNGLAVENHSNMLKALNNLTKWLIDNKKYKYLSPPDLFTGEITCLINWGSPAQVAKLLAEEGIPVEVIDEEKSLEYSDLLEDDIVIYKYMTGRTELAKYESNELVKLFLLYKKYQKATTTYGEEWIRKFINPVTKRVHTSFDQIKNTGRLGSYSPNVQQIPSFKSEDKLSCEAHRTCFSTPEGWSLVVKDYSSCESRILADYADEDSMIELFTAGDSDIHSLTARKVYKKPVSKKENKHLRQIGKMLNFAIAYGASGYKVSKQVGVSKEEGDALVESYYEAFPKLHAYFKQWHTYIKLLGYLTLDNVIYRKMYFPFYKEYITLKEKLEGESREYKNSKEGRREMSQFMKLRGMMERVSQNYRIQSTNASMTKLALIKLYEYLLAENLFKDVKIVLSLHDEIVVECKDYIASTIDSKLTEFMLESGKVFCKKVPMVVDGGVTKVWDH